MIRRKKKKTEGSGLFRWVLERSIAFAPGEETI